MTTTLARPKPSKPVHVQVAEAYSTSEDRFKADILAGRLVEGMNFQQKIWALTSRIPRGRVTTYGQLAHAIDSKAYRAVGMAMNRNPYAPTVPCHRVIGSTGQLTGFAHGIETKRKMLEEEGVLFCGAKVVLNQPDQFYEFT